MNIQDNSGKALTKATVQPSLPPLVKGSSTYKIIVPKKVEEKIRYLCRKFPTLEWSGILFTSYEGNFEDGSLVITCQDLYPMDLGTSTYTEFRTDETVAGYIAENIDLFGCDMSLIHSHNQMNCWFSGTDLSTLRSEGNDQNCFVSLIVNNAGKYCAAITRKVQSKKKIYTENYGSSYEFFGEGKKNLTNDVGKGSEEVIENTYIEYFDLEVQVEQVDNPLAYLDTRFEEIQSQKKKAVAPNSPTIKLSDSKGYWDKEDYSFNEWMEMKKGPNAVSVRELSLFPDEDVDTTDIFKWEPDPNIIHRLVCQMVTCSLIVSDDIDLKQWITRWMDKKYKEIFGPEGSESTQFKEWKEFIVEFMVNQALSNDVVPSDVVDDWDLVQSRVASALHDELHQYTPNEDNVYINDYMEVLTRYIYE